MARHIHIISFNIPYPPDYGGVMDVYFKIKALHNAGIRVSLHCFQYGRTGSPEIEKICHRVYYYPRKTGPGSHFSFLPYILYSRRSVELLSNLHKDQDPIFFEGLHSSYYLNHKSLRNRYKIVRAHNIEHKYYLKLFGSEKKTMRKFFFLMESAKLFLSQRRMKHADHIAAISRKEEKYFRGRFNNVFLLNAFHSSEKVNILAGKGKYLLYHGNLSVPENIKSVNFLIEKVFSKIDFPVIIAGKNPGDKLRNRLKSIKHIELVSSPGEQEMKELLQNAHASILISFQDTGLKLKLLEALFSGRHCIANDMIAGETRLRELCEIANSASEIIVQIRKILDLEFSEDQIKIRRNILSEYENKRNARKLIDKLPPV